MAERSRQAAHPPRERRRLSLREALRWAYSRQMVDIVTGKRLSEGGSDERRAVSADGIARLMHVKALGCRVDGGGGSWGASLACHPDAEKIHDAVLALGELNARLVIEFGYTGLYPEPCVPRAEPCPASPGIEHVVDGTREVGDRVGRGIFDGAVTFFRIAVAELVIERRPVYRKAARGKLLLSHVEERRHEVEYCPIRWWPDPVWAEAVNGIHAHWQGVLAALAENLRGVPLADHEIIDLKAHLPQKLAH